MLVTPTWQDTATALGTVITGVAAVSGLGITIALSNRERSSRRREAESSVAADVLDNLDFIETHAPWLWSAGEGGFRPIPAQRNWAAELLQARDDIIRRSVPKLRNSAVSRRLVTLCELMHEIAFGGLRSKALEGTPLRARIDADFRDYLVYVRSSVAALMADSPLPPERAAPALRSDDPEVG